MKIRDILEAEEKYEVETENKHFTFQLVRAGRTAKKLAQKKGPDKKIKISEYRNLVDKSKKDNKEILEIIQNIFGNKQEMTPKEFINGIYSYDKAPKNIRGIISLEDKYQTTQRLIPDDNKNKTVNATIFSSIFDDLNKKFPNANEEFRDISIHLNGHFLNSAAFVRYTKMTDDWIHFDAFQTDFFNKLRAFKKNKEGVTREMFEFLLSKEEEFYKLAVSYVAKSNPSVKQFTASTVDLVKKAENVSGAGKLRQLYEKLPKKLGFEKINLDKLKKIFDTRPGKKNEKKKEYIKNMFNYSKLVMSSESKNEILRALTEIESSFNNIFNKKDIVKKQEDIKHELDSIINSIANKRIVNQKIKEYIISAFHQELDKYAKELKKGEKIKPLKMKQVLDFIEKKESVGIEKEIWWTNKGLIFENKVEKYFNKLFEEVKVLR
jgi:hypothetical protein